jgi:hypothetical protein
MGNEKLREFRKGNRASHFLEWDFVGVRGENEFSPRSSFYLAPFKTKS